ncbi:MAG: flagellar filament capping protein FliD [Oscillospiraceae bacterium]
MATDPIRLSGLNSGFDTESIIEAMMSTYQTKIDNQNKKLTKLQWQQQAYQSITKSMTDFKNKYFDVLNRDTYLMSPNTFNKFSSTITSPTDKTSGLDVTTTYASLEGSYKIKTTQLATAASLKGASIKPESFKLDLEKAAQNSAYTEETFDDGVTRRNYSFALDVQVGNVTKTVAFDVSTDLTDAGELDMDAFRQSTVDSLNIALQDAFGHTGRNGAGATGVVDANGDEWFLQTELNAQGGLEFKAGGNAAVSVTEKQGVFGLAKTAAKQNIDMGSVVTGTNTVSVTVGGVTKNISFEGVASTYYDSVNEAGNEDLLKEYNELKAAAFRKENKLSAYSPIDEKAFAEFRYTAAQAAKDKNTAALKSALNEGFSSEGKMFTIDNNAVTIADGSEFSITSAEGGTLGLEKGTAASRYNSNTKLADMGFEADADGKYKLNINGVEISMESGSTIGSLITAVNNSEAGVTMSFSALTNSFNLDSKEMGSGSSIEVLGNDFAKAIGLTDENGDEVNVTKGQNAVFEINGQEIYHNSNEYTIDGTTFKFNDDIELGETMTVGITKSYDDVKQLIKDFVADYNKLIDDVYEQIGTEPQKDSKGNTYEPLTDAEKAEMSEEQIKDWEEAAKKGVLYNDQTVSSLMSQMRTMIYSSITLDDGSKFGLFNMGIKATSDYKEHGKLEIDEDKLNAAFSKNPEAIQKLFTDQQNGVMRKVSNVLDSAVKSTGAKRENMGILVQKAGLASGSTSTDNYINDQMKRIKEQISKLQNRYDDKEAYWWKVFTNLESMMTDLNSQTNYISQYLGGSTNYQ